MIVSSSNPSLAVPVLPVRRWWVWALVPAVVALSLGGYWFKSRAGGDSAGAINGTFYTVIPTELDVKIAKDGELQAINNLDIQCHVEGINTITYVVPEGSSVKQGDVLVTL